MSVSVVYDQRRVINTTIYKKVKCNIYIYIYIRLKHVAVPTENVVVFDGTVKDLLLSISQHERMYSTKIRLCSVVTIFAVRPS